MTDDKKPQKRSLETTKAADVDEVRQSRRRVLNRVVLGTGIASVPLSSSWTRPVINTVVMPAHAQTSPQQDDGGGEGTFVTVCEVVATSIVGDPTLVEGTTILSATTIVVDIIECGPVDD